MSSRSLLRATSLILVFLAAIYVGPAVLLYGLQDGMLFPAPSYSRATFDAKAPRRGARPVAIPAADGLSLYGWYTPSDGERLAIYFHGNASTPAEASRLREHYVPRGYAILAPTYRGYGPNEGLPSEAALIEDARAVWRYATEELGHVPAEIVLHGRSLGGGVATALAAEVRPRALVLECTFASVRDVAAERYPIYPIGWLLRHPFDSVARAPRVSVPTLVVHGDADRVVPIAHGRRLAQAFPNARYVEVAGEGHDGPLIVGGGEPLKAFLELLGGR